MSTLVEQIKLGLTRLDQDPEQRLGLMALVTTTRKGVAQQLLIFRRQWPGDPEITSKEAASVEGSFLSLGETLAQLEAELQRGGSVASRSWIETIDLNLAPLQSLRARPAPLTPTSNGWVNRALIHLDYSLSEGHTSEASRIFLQTLPEEEERMARLLDSVPEDTETGLRSFAESILGLLDGWVECGANPLPPEAKQWPQQMLAWQQQFDQALAEYIQEVASQAPTAFPVLNLILAACSPGKEDPRLMAGARALCAPAIHLLRSQIDPFVQQQPACQDLFGLLERGPEADFAVRLEPLAHEVAQSLALYSAEEPLLSHATQSAQELALPPLLGSIWAAARRHTQNRDAESELRQGVNRLQTLLKGSQSASDSQLKVVRQDVGKVILLLQEIASHPNQDALEELGLILEDCAESLQQLEAEQLRS